MLDGKAPAHRNFRPAASYNSAAKPLAGDFLFGSGPSGLHGSDETVLGACELILIGHSLTTNHVHCAIIPPTAEALSLGVGRLNQEYSRLQNMLHGRTGHLWQNRFYSCPVDPSRIWQVPANVELYPVRAGLVKRASDWRWSSAQAHVIGADDSGLHDMTLWRQQFDGPSWD